MNPDSLPQIKISRNPSDSSVTDQQSFQVNPVPEKKLSILLSLPFFLLALLSVWAVVSSLGPVMGGDPLILFLIPLMTTIISFPTAFGIIKKDSWAGLVGLITIILLSVTAVWGIMWGLNYTPDPGDYENWGELAAMLFIVIGAIIIIIAAFTIRPLWKLWHSRKGTTIATSVDFTLKKFQINFIKTFIIINFTVIILTEILAEVMSSYWGNRFKPFLYVHSSLVLFAVSTLLFYRIKKSVGNDSEKAILVLQKIRKYLFLSLIIAMPVCLLTWLFSGIADKNLFEENIFFPLILMVPPYIFLTALITIPFLTSSLKSKNEGKNSANSSPVSGQNLPTPTQPQNSDRFPTLDAQPKPQNTPPDGQKQS